MKGDINDVVVGWAYRVAAAVGVLIVVAFAGVIAAYHWIGW